VGIDVGAHHAYSEPDERPLGKLFLLTTTDILPARATSDGTLRRIYEEALKRFAERGYHGTSIRDIAEACGIKPSSIYAHVPSKERILHDLILLGHEEHRDRLRDALLDAGAEPADQLRGVVGAHVRMHAELPMLATVANNELHGLPSDVAPEVTEIRDQAVQMIVDVIERGVRLGRFHCDDPFLATAIVGAAGIRVAVWLPGDSNYDAEQVIAAYADAAVKLVS
jgi:AcrR family transcriptional regulator